MTKLPVSIISLDSPRPIRALQVQNRVLFSLNGSSIETFYLYSVLVVVYRYIFLVIQPLLIDLQMDACQYPLPLFPGDYPTTNDEPDVDMQILSSCL